MHLDTDRADCMTRDEILIQLCTLKKQFAAISVVTMGAIPKWHALGGDGQDHLDITGMGLAASVGLGLALGRPDRLVMVIDGDGSLLMELGILAVIGHEGPSNFHHFVMVNNEYETTGHQPTPEMNWLAAGEAVNLWSSELIPYRLDFQGPKFYPLPLEQAEPEAYPLLDLPAQVRKLREELWVS